MAQHRHQGGKRGKRSQAPPPVRTPLPVMERKAPVVYGKPFIVLEDARKVTYIYSGGKWVEHTKSIAACREDSQVKQLPQKINGMTRYEVSPPLYGD